MLKLCILYPVDFFNEKALMKFKSIVLATSIAMLSAGCQTTAQQSEQLKLTSQEIALAKTVLDTEVEALWKVTFDHHQPGQLKAIAKYIQNEVETKGLSSKAVEKLMYYLRIYSSFGPNKDWQEGSLEALNDALLSVTQAPNFYQINATSARVHENYAVALYRFYFNEGLQQKVEQHIPVLTKLLSEYSTADLPKDKAVDYGLWEVIRASAILPYEAKRKNKPEFSAQVLNEKTLEKALVSFISSKNAVVDGDDWPKEHALWALGQFYNLYAQQYWNEYYKLDEDTRKALDDDKTALPVEKDLDALDESVWSALSKDGLLDEKSKKTLFSIPYVVSSFRGKSACEEGTLKDRCIMPSIDEALPIKYNCSDSVFIRTQEMTEAQLSQSCQRLNEQVGAFHEKLATNEQPVANDFNDKLRIVIFDNAAEYNKYGQLIFDIHTDNGGMYIEGTTQNPDNLATFYTFEHFWIRPEFGVWNLNHEFVHYLDGRFNKYDTYGHFQGNLVWWSEGLAEYIAQEDDNPRAFKKAFETEEQDWPSLLDIFNTEYKDGTDRVYKWGYLAVRFMYENHREDYLKMAHYLRTDFFEGYKSLLDKTGEAYAEEFKTWVLSHKAEHTKEEKAADKRQPRQFYRYTYKDYLQPKHLVEDKDHMLWQYWHENARRKAAGDK
jgi:microbial collagenase